MIARVQSYLLAGIDALPCEVEIDFSEKDLAEGDRPTHVVGLPDAAVKESNDRVRAALFNSNLKVPFGKVLINLAPADVQKAGPVYDLPIAIGLLAAQGVIGRKDAPTAPSTPTASKGDEFPESKAWKSLNNHGLDMRKFLFAGELALDGRLRPVKGVIALASLAKARNMQGVIVPWENGSEAAVVQGIEVYGVRTLSEAVGLLTGALEAQPVPSPDIFSILTTATTTVDFLDVRGQEGVKRAMTLAAAGSHNILMLGPAGTGKTMMAKALPGILPPLSAEEAIEITRIYSSAGALPPGQGLISVRPVRTPHHTASAPAVVGGGAVPRPGEISLAHHGVLFLDELPEFPRVVLETLRQPMEDHVVTIARASGSLKFPASFMLVAAMNPTPKGDMPTNDFSRMAMERYMSKISGPLLDRIDIHVEAPAVPWKELSKTPTGTSTATMRADVLRAREKQSARQGASCPNARLSGKQLDVLAPMTDQARTVLGQAMTEMGLSARAYDKIRRVARTIADIAGDEMLDVGHVTEAIQYRVLDRKI